MLWMSQLRQFLQAREREWSRGRPFIFQITQWNCFLHNISKCNSRRPFYCRYTQINPDLISWSFPFFSYNDNNNNNNNLPEMFPKQCASLYIITCFCIKRIHYNPLWPVDRVFRLPFLIHPSHQITKIQQL